MRIAIIGNSGSGKSTLARQLARQADVPILELDSIVWEPGQVAVQRDPRAIDFDLHSFLDANGNWIVEGCYSELISAVLPLCTELIFLNPAEAACLQNNRKRPWERHKYESAQIQASMLDYLLEWTAGYYTRDDQWSLRAHRRLFDAYGGHKREIAAAIDATAA
jgi:adenylate kinase family enzyme